jgi:AraC-like DNA-binding protein
MKFLLAHAASGSRLRLDAAESPGNDSLTIAVCQRGSAATVRAGTVALWCPVRGDARVVAGDCNVQLSRGDIFVTDAHGSHEVTVSNHGLCIGIVGTPQAWAATGRGRPGESSAMALFPAVHRDKAALCRQFLRFARLCVADRDGLGGGHRAHVLAALVDELQSGFREMIARCPGSSLSRKNAVFLRLQRVRSYITACAHRDLDVASLALMANYSVGHFITTFRSVFAETPYSSVNRYRLESASGLLSASELGISDIAQSIGFQSRSSFNRAIKRHLGLSASKYRETMREALAR